jgi:hypothetical protein
METNTRKLIEFIGSKWLFVITVLVFIAESSWLAVTSRFPMAFDEAYHFGLIQFFSHHLNPIVTHQTASTYKYGAIIQDPSFLYHYLMSFPYRLIVLFTKSLEIQVIDLRLISVALAVVTLLILRKILQLLNVSAALANVLLLAFALTPIVVVLSAQINYDNLLIPGTSFCIYETLLLIKKLDEKGFDTRTFLILYCACLFTSMVMFSFLPILVAIAVIVLWKTARYKHPKAVSLAAKVRKDLAHMRKASKWLLLGASLLVSLLFIRVYGVNVVEYHNPAPQCSQVLNVQDCKYYYAWDSNYLLRQYHEAHPKPNKMSVFEYTSYWFVLCTLDLFGAIMPLQGLSYVSPVYIFLVGGIGALALICTIANFKQMLQKNQGLAVVTFISFIYLLSLWARNYHDDLQLGQPVAISGRYFVPVLLYLYILLGTGVGYALDKHGFKGLALKTSLALIILYSFVCYGGYNQYLTHIDPIYGRINAGNDYNL